MDSDRLAEIYANDAVGDSYGTGYLIAPRLVLTARHVIAPALAVGGKCEVRFLGDVERGQKDWKKKFSPCWNDEALDIALLRQSEDEPGYAAGPAAPERVGKLERSAGPSVDCLAVGFPKMLRRDDANDTQQIDGKIPPLTMIKEKQWQIKVTSAQPKNELDWEGVSGAPVFCARHLIGVILKTETCYLNGVLIVQPLDAAFALATWRDALPPGIDIESITGRHDPRPWDGLYRLVYLVDREMPVSELKNALRQTISVPNAPRVFACVIPGAVEQEHCSLIELFRNETMPSLFPGRPGFDRIECIEWPEPVSSVAQGLARLRSRVHTLLDVQDTDKATSPTRIARALNGNDKPRAFFSEIRATSFTPLQRDLVQAWLQEWSKVGTAGLNDIVALFLCLVFDAPTPQRRWWKVLGPAVDPLRAFAQDTFRPLREDDLWRDENSVRMLKLPDLNHCRRNPDMRAWREKIEKIETQRWLADYVTTVELNVPADPFPLRTLIETLQRLSQPSGRVDR